MAKEKTKPVKGTCSACLIFRANPGGKKNEQVKNLCCLTGDRKVINEPFVYSCPSYQD
jgi:hypothetical protein